MNKTNLYRNPILGAALALGVALALALALVFPAAAAPHAQGMLFKVYVTNLRDTFAVISWTTASDANGAVDYGATTALGSTKSDPVASTTTHYVELDGLLPSTTYYFQVRSGSTTDDNGGAFYTFTTGPSPTPPGPSGVILGYVYESNGSAVAPNSIVYIQLQDADGSGSPGSSQWGSARANASGIWSFTPSNLRTADAGAYFTFSTVTDNLRLVWQGGSQGVVGETPGDIRLFPVPANSPWQQDMILDSTPNAVTVAGMQARPGAGQPGVLGLALALAAALGLGGYFTLRRRKA